MSSLHQLLTNAAAAYPKNVAVVDPGRAVIDYQSLEAASSRLAETLERHGIGNGDRVAVNAPKSIGTVASLFGVVKSGAAYVPLDPSSPSRRRVEIMEDCGVRAIIADSRRSEELRSESREELRVLERHLFPSEWGSDLLLLAAKGEAAAEKSPKELAYILYTSGSTGKPKGVVHTHSSALSFVDWCSEEFAPSSEDKFSSHAPFHFDLSILDLFVPIKHGAAVVLIGEEAGKQPAALASIISENRLTVWYSTPSILRLLMEFGKLNRHDHSSLRLVLFAG
jgi:non-ribosomal peptide synthetase component F